MRRLAVAISGEALIAAMIRLHFHLFQNVSDTSGPSFKKIFRLVLTF
jgi:hypothetical protein